MHLKAIRLIAPLLVALLLLGITTSHGQIAQQGDSHYWAIQRLADTELEVGGFRDWTSFKTRVLAGSDGVAQYIAGRLSPTARAALSAGGSTAAAVLANQGLVQNDMNALIKGPSVYDAARFQGVALRPETQSLVTGGATGAKLARMNQLLLEDAFPSELWRGGGQLGTIIAQRGSFVGPAGIPPRDLILAPNTKYRYWLHNANGGTEGHVDFTTPAAGLSFTIPPAELRPPVAPDLDGDGLSGDAELIINTDPLRADTDGDGINDGVALKSGLDPARGSITGVIASVDTPGTAVDICTFNDLALVADSEAGVAIFNIFNAMKPVLIGQVDTPGIAKLVACTGPLAAIGDGWGGLVILNVSNAINARIHLQLDPSALQTGGEVRALATAGDLAYVGVGVHVLAIRMQSGEIVGRIDSTADALAEVGDRLYVLTPTTLEIWSSFERGMTNLGATWVSGGAPPLAIGRNLAVGGDFAYVGHFTGISSVGIVGPGSPRLLGTPATTQAVIHNMVLSGAGELVAVTSFFGESTLAAGVYEVPQTGAVTNLLGAYTTPGLPRAVSIYNGVAYFADGLSGLTVLNYKAIERRRTAPTLALRTSLSNNEVMEGSTVAFFADLLDDVQGRNVEFYVDGERAGVDGGFPFEMRYRVPWYAERTNLIVRVRGSDTGGNATWSEPLQLQITRDPGIRSLTGRVLGTDDTPVQGADVTIDGVDVGARTDYEGRFVVHGVRVSPDAIAVRAVLPQASELPLTAETMAILDVPGHESDIGVMVARTGFPGMVYIPPGTFMMGSPGSEPEREFGEAQHTVTLTKGFYMSRYEVTQAEFQAIVGGNPSAFRDGTFPSEGGVGGPVLDARVHPVDRVSWPRAVLYCQLLTERERRGGRLPNHWTIRLPTEAEWEYACRAGTTSPFHYGDRLSSGMANFDGRQEYDVAVGTITNLIGTYLGRTSRVGSYEPNAFGLYDMHGNVAEWSWDTHVGYGGGPLVDPIGPVSGLKDDIARGGSWRSGRGGSGADNRSAVRIYTLFDGFQELYGFRTVLAQSQTTSIVGEVRDAEGRVVDGATVTIGDVARATRSGRDGQFLLEGVPTGAGAIRLSAILLREGQAPLWAVSRQLTASAGHVLDLGVLTVQEGVRGLVYIPPGSFNMGSPVTELGRSSDELVHAVRLTSGFLMSQHEVTQEEYERVIGHNPSYFRNGTEPNASFTGFPPSGGRVVNDRLHPVEQINWHDATNFCARLTQQELEAGRLPHGWHYRLPTEAEWEYACRAGTTSAFHYGPELRSGMANFLAEYEYVVGNDAQENRNGVYLGRTSPVGSYEANGFGLFDMHGNVWEWCADWYETNPGSAHVNPQGPDVGTERVLRGSSLGNVGSVLRSARRNRSLPETRTEQRGIRTVLAMPDPDNLAPTVIVRLANPRTTVEANDTIVVIADASDDVEVLKVDFFMNGARIGTDYESPYEIEFLAPGSQDSETSFRIDARAMDNEGVVTTSEPLQILVLPDTRPPLAHMNFPELPPFSQTVDIFFDEEIDEETLSTEAVMLLSAGVDMVLGTDDDALLDVVDLTYGEEGGQAGQRSQVRLSVAEALSSGEYRIILRTGIADRRGNTLTEAQILTISVRLDASHAIAAGRAHSAAIAMDGGVWAWGDNSGGQLGSINESGSWEPILLESTNRWGSIACGDQSTLAIDLQGRLWVWGYPGPYLDGVRSPVDIGGENHWVMVTASDSNSAAIQADGSLWTWGTRPDLLGDGVGGSGRGLPKRLQESNEWARVSGGRAGFVGLKRDGSLWVWGSGIPRPTRLSHTNTVHGEVLRWKSAVKGFDDVWSIATDGTLWRSRIVEAQGTGFSQIGTNRNWTELRRGGVHTLGLQSNGTLWGWGGDSFGQAGHHRSNTVLEMPRQIGNQGNWVGVAAGGYHSFGIRADRTLWSWGANQFGQRGDRVNSHSRELVRVAESNTFRVADAGRGFSLAIDSNRMLWGWGENRFGQLGNGSLQSTAVPQLVSEQPGWHAVSAGDEYALATDGNGKVWGWGRNDQVWGNSSGTPPRLGTNATVPVQLTPVAIGEVPTGAWQNVAAGLNEMAVGDATGRIQFRRSGAVWEALGDVSMRQFDASTLVFFGIDDRGMGWHAGWNLDGALLGVGNAVTLRKPVRFGWSGESWAELTSSGSLAAGVTAGGKALVWGNLYEAGLSRVPGLAAEPMELAGASGWRTVALSDSGGLGIDQDGALWAFGDSAVFGAPTAALGQPRLLDAGPGWQSVRANRFSRYSGISESHAILLKSDGSLWTFGYGDQGQLGNGYPIGMRQIGIGEEWGAP